MRAGKGTPHITYIFARDADFSRCCKVKEAARNSDALILPIAREEHLCDLPSYSFADAAAVLPHT